jgi:hypothetical protein
MRSAQETGELTELFGEEPPSPRSSSFRSRQGPAQKSEHFPLRSEQDAATARYGARNSVSAPTIASGACSATQWPAPGHEQEGGDEHPGVEVQADEECPYALP